MWFGIENVKKNITNILYYTGNFAIISIVLNTNTNNVLRITTNHVIIKIFKATFHNNGPYYVEMRVNTSGE